MDLRRGLGAVLALLMLGSAPAAGFAAAKDTVLNKEGYWGIDVDRGACAASMNIRGGVLLFRAAKGAVTFALFARKPMKRGKVGVIRTEAYGFDFEPSYSEASDTLYLDDELNDRALAALRLARELHIQTDGREVLGVNLEGTGFEGALDGVIACSRGESGWWGKGVSSDRAEQDEKPATPVNKEGFWAVEANQEENSCTAIGTVDDKTLMVFVASDGDISFGVSTGATLRKGSRGVFETEAYSFNFTPSYDDNYLYFDEAVSERGLAALRLARTLRISVDRRTIADMKVEGTGLESVLSDIVECSRGKSGWWGLGVRKAQAGERSTGGSPAQGGGSGSAFFVSADGLAVTAAHVVKDCATLNSQRWGPVKVLATDPRADLAILKAQSASGEFVALRSRGPKLGEAVSAGGYPLGGLLGAGLKITTGVVSGLSGPEGDRGLFQISASIQPGNSGGPVVDGGGALIGVTAAKLDELKFSQATGAFPQNVNFAVPVTVLQSFLDENAVKYRTSGPAPTPSGSAGLPNYTFSVVCLR
jgi:S1-C subfamily serine protease